MRAYGSAAWCSTFRTLALAGSRWSRWPRPSRRVLTRAIAADLGPVASTASMRPRTREAVSGFLVQIGSSTLSTSAVSTADTGSLPTTGSRRLRACSSIVGDASDFATLLRGR